MHKFTLIENAADSLKHAIDHIDPVHDTKIGNWKRAILDLSHVVELMFKERLKSIHPSLMWRDVDKYPSSKAFTVSSEQAFNRLKKIIGVEFTECEEEFIEKLRIKRNEIEHFEFDISNDEARMIIGHILSFILHFAKRELDLEWQNQYLDHNKWNILKGYTEFYEQQLEKIEKLIEDEALGVLVCPSCHHETFNIDTEKCLLCSHQEEMLECKSCKEPYLCSDVEYENAGLCPQCEYEDGYASANFEKY